MPSQMRIGSPEWQSVVVSGAGKLGVAVTAQQADRFAAHALEMIQWNRKVNLTAITDPLEIAVKHYLDSIIAVPLIKPGSTLLDVGSGAGFPGIPLKILMPSLKTTLLDARRKRINFLKYIIREMGMVNTDAIHTRVENLHESVDFRESFDIAVCRAFTGLGHLIDLILPLLKPGGKLIAYKGKKTIHEINAIATPLGLKTTISTEMMSHKLPYLDTDRILVQIEKK